MAVWYNQLILVVDDNILQPCKLLSEILPLAILIYQVFWPSDSWFKRYIQKCILSRELILTMTSHFSKSIEWFKIWKNKYHKNEMGLFLNPFVPSAPFLYPLKTSENLMVFWCFLGVEKGWVNRITTGGAEQSWFECFFMKYSTVLKWVNSFSYQCSISLPPENVRKPLVFWRV